MIDARFAQKKAYPYLGFMLNFQNFNFAFYDLFINSRYLIYLYWIWSSCWILFG